MLALLTLIGLTWYSWAVLRTPNPFAKFIFGAAISLGTQRLIEHFDTHRGPYPHGYINLITHAMILPMTLGLFAFLAGTALMVLSPLIPPAPPRRPRPARRRTRR